MKFAIAAEHVGQSLAGFEEGAVPSSAVLAGIRAEACAHAGVDRDDYALAVEQPGSELRAYQDQCQMDARLGSSRSVTVLVDAAVYFTVGVLRWGAAAPGFEREALRCFDACLAEIDPGDMRAAGALCYRGLCKERLGDHQGALADLERAEQVARRHDNAGTADFAAEQRARVLAG